MAVGSLAHILDQFEGLSEVPLRGSPLRGCIISGKSGLARQRPQGMRGQEAAAQAPVPQAPTPAPTYRQAQHYQHRSPTLKPAVQPPPPRPDQPAPQAAAQSPAPLQLKTHFLSLSDYSTLNRYSSTSRIPHPPSRLRFTQNHPRLSTPSNYSRYTAEALLSILDNSAFKQRPMTLPKHNPTSEDSVNAARFRAKHALMHWTGCKDEGCQYHSSSLINQNRAPPNNHCSYCDERSHYTYVCKIYQADQRYLQALAAEDQPPPASPLLSPTSPPEMTPETSPKSTGWTYLEKGKEKAIQRSRIFII
ncbi:hypothetical protein BGX38DRAFT_1269775 [Terfezia claveryi]|nr:hypothetical protein BGX38DRAFT_1269775 [Terfezia claveryi]